MPERADHISCECEFLCFLTRKETYALEHKNEQMLKESRKAQRLFLKNHLGRFVPSFTQSLVREAPDNFYGALGSLCFSFVLTESARYGVSLGSDRLRLRSQKITNECFTCGSGEEVIQDMCDSNCNVE
ncbi:molecular chaperone TorD family protein [candidate division KSB1 bacterium]|nr:molecular chaperone TorD family protein [candidate division KSB1 bacterium]